MKYLVVFLLPISMSAQSFQELVLKYEKDCAEIVIDTIQQTGFVFTNTESGTDTIWTECECPTYKYEAGIWYSGITYGGTDYFFTREQTKPYKEISRGKICRVKKREVEPFSDDFWNWIKNQ